MYCFNAAKFNLLYFFLPDPGSCTFIYGLSANLHLHSVHIKIQNLPACKAILFLIDASDQRSMGKHKQSNSFMTNGFISRTATPVWLLISLSGLISQVLKSHFKQEMQE